ncbi:hypothetical protein TSUD_28550 [Trifolium subterraneum]|uniref:SAC3/GANP/THP3 conserved domain-containing protein n=1 Tax=Trifolium subterraneum TaxID=3900 RepID=A0A2Z6P5X9_TRISU|nr:hypothetical protein TSUD_28550 [Trifolium subterraneum]
MSVQEHVGNEKSCVWHARDFSDVELKDELFCIRFLSIEKSERGERERKGDLDQYERVDGDRNVTSRLLAVKKREASLNRPMSILKKTIGYLLTLLDQPYDERFLRIYNFLWDKMRAIRMDLRMKHIFNQGAIIMLEQMKHLVVSVRGDEPYEELEILKGVATMLLHGLPYTKDRISRVHAARRDDLVIGAGSHAGALLVDGLMLLEDDKVGSAE